MDDILGRCKALYLKMREALFLIKWVVLGRRGAPPHIIKRYVVRKYQRMYKSPVFVETGTFEGRMIEGVASCFKKIISIELDSALARRAKEKLAHFSNVTIIEGDSSVLLPSILMGIDEPILFWLDGHYSGTGTSRGDTDTPILEELRAIALKGGQSVILIDDARLFTGEHDYPTLEKIRTFSSEFFPNHRMSVYNDIIRIAIS